MNKTSIRTSKKRLAILDAIRASSDHPSAEMLYAELKPRWPDLSLATIYRNLAFFQECGEIIRVGSVNGQERYDGRTQPHSHFICLGCGKIDDVELPDLAPGIVYRRIGQLLGAEVNYHQLTFYGHCQSCCKSREKLI